MYIFLQKTTLVLGMYPVSRDTLQTYKKLTHRTPGLGSTICGTQKLLSHVWFEHIPLRANVVFDSCLRALKRNGQQLSP